MKYKILLFLVILLAFFLRFFQLGSNPPSLDWDEASLGYNAYSILKTGRDEYGSFLPLSIRSFGDYKPPLYTYLTVIPVGLLGLNEYSVRFTSAILGVLTVIVTYFLVRKLMPEQSKIFYLLSFAFISLSPWHIQFSRVAFEANTGLFFVVTGTWLFLKSLRRKFLFIASFISYGLAVYAYHSPRLVLPIFVTGLIIIFRHKIRENLGIFLAGAVILIIMIIPILGQLKSATGARFGSVTILNADERLGTSIKDLEQDIKSNNFPGRLMHNRRIVFAREILAGYLDHFNVDFLALSGDAAGRHHALGMGMLYIWDLPFIILGMFALIRRGSKSVSVLFWWFVTAPIASSVTKATPHAVRALLYLPVYQIFAAYGVTEIMNTIRKRLGNKIGKIALFPVFLFFILNFIYYLDTYFVHTPKYQADWWQFGYKEAISEVARLEKSYGKIIFTYYYDQPYVYYLFYNLIDPSWYQRSWGGGQVYRDIRKIGKYEFRKIDWSIDNQLENVLLVGSPKEIPSDANGLLREIKFPDGNVAFRIVSR